MKIATYNQNCKRGGQLAWDTDGEPLDNGDTTIWEGSEAELLKLAFDIYSQPVSGSNELFRWKEARNIMNYIRNSEAERTAGDVLDAIIDGCLNTKDKDRAYIELLLAAADDDLDTFIERLMIDDEARTIERAIKDRDKDARQVVIGDYAVIYEADVERKLRELIDDVLSS